MLMPAATASPVLAQHPPIMQNGGVGAASNGTPPAAVTGISAVSPAVAQAAVVAAQQNIVSPTTATMTMPTVTTIQPNGQSATTMVTNPAAAAAAAAAIAAAGMANTNVAAAIHQSVAATSPVITAVAPQQTAQKDTTFTKLFVGGLPYHTTDKSLREHFEVYGDIEEAVVITDRQTGKSRGYGFVIMATKESAEKACKEPNPIIDGRKANVNLAILGAKPRVNTLQAGLPLTTALRQSFQTALLPAQYGIPTASSTQSAAASNHYLQSMYAAAAAAAAASNPYAAAALQGNAAGSALLPLTAAAPGSHIAAAGSTGNPLLDAYASQYAAQLAAAGVYTTSSGSINGLEAQPGVVTTQAAAGYLPAAGGYYAMPAAQLQQSAALYAAAAQPTSANHQQSAAATDGRLQ